MNSWANIYFIFVWHFGKKWETNSFSLLDWQLLAFATKREGSSLLTRINNASVVFSWFYSISFSFTTSTLVESNLMPRAIAREFLNSPTFHTPDCYQTTAFCRRKKNKKSTKVWTLRQIDQLLSVKVSNWKTRFEGKSLTIVDFFFFHQLIKTEPNNPKYLIFL